MYYTYIDTPVSTFMIAGNEAEINYTSFTTGDREIRPREDWVEDAGPFKEPVDQLSAYFEGDRRAFDLTLAPHGTEFQLSVWSALQTIPYGTTWSYGDLSRKIGNPKAVRAVGAANGANPIPVIIPCHRVIGANGTLTGFGGGLDKKAILLQLEGVSIDEGDRQLELI